MVTEDATPAPDDAVALEMVAAIVTPEVGPAETTDAFLTGVSAALKASDDVDADLAVILSDHLLRAKPHVNAVAKAKAAITTLAAKRAAPIVGQTDG